MKPDGRNIPTKVLAIHDEDGNEMESCPHSKQKLIIFLSVLPDAGDILRTPNKTI
jgi:putative protease